jgi:hypothetical protein
MQVAALVPIILLVIPIGFVGLVSLTSHIIANVAYHPKLSSSKTK